MILVVAMLHIDEALYAAYGLAVEAVELIGLEWVTGAGALVGDREGHVVGPPVLPECVL